MPQNELGFSTIDDAILAINEGRLVIVVDDEDRENEGDFIGAAEKVTPEMVNFMVTHGRGIFCVPILADRAEELLLMAAAEDNTSLMGTAFTVSVDASSCHTGTSAYDRCETVKVMIDPKTRPADLARPGHVFPIIARNGGVLRRAGHTEAAVDLARLAGLYPAGVICEILDDEGGMARRDQLLELSRQFDLPIITIEDLIRHRRRIEKLVVRVAGPAKLPTVHGDFEIIGYEVKYERQEPFALILGELSRSEAPLVRMHSSCFTGDVLDSLRCECGDQLELALKMISREGVGALVYLPQEGRGIGLIEKIKAYTLQDRGMDTVEANIALGHRADMRDYGVGIQILKDLGLSRVRLLTNNPKKSSAFILGGYELKVVDQVPIIASPDPHRVRYMETKRLKMGHCLPEMKPDKEEGKK